MNPKKHKIFRRKRPKQTPNLHSRKIIKPTSKYSPSIEDAKHKKEK